MKDSKAKILVHNTKWIYISKIISQLLALISGILVIRQLNVDIYGTYSLLINLFFIFEFFALSGISQTFLRFIPEFIANKEYGKFKKFIKNSFLFSSLVFLLVFYFVFLLRSHFATFFNIPEFDKYILVFAFFTFSYFLQELFSITLQALLLHKIFALLTILNNALRTILYIVFLENLDVTLLLYIEVLLALTIIVPSLFVYLKHSTKLDEKTAAIRNTQITLKRLLRYSLFSTANVIGQGIVGRKSDYFIVAALSNPYQVGLLAFANKVFELIYKILPIKDFYSVLRPLFFQKFSQKYCIEDFQKTVSFMIKVLLPLFLFPFLYFIYFGHHIIKIIFDPKYSAAYWIIVILLFTKPLNPFFNTIALIAQLKERVDFEMYSKITIVFSLFCGIFAMKYVGIIGVAAASTLGMIIQNSILWFLMRKYPESKIKIREYNKYLILILLTTPFLGISFINIGLVFYILTSLIFATYYTLLLLLINPLSKYDTELLDKIMSNSSFLIKIRNSIVSISENKYFVFIKNSI